MNSQRLQDIPKPDQKNLDYRVNLRKVTKGTGIGGAGELFYTALIYITNLTISRFLGAEGMGIYAQAVTITLLLTMLARVGLEAGALRYISIYMAQKDFRHLEGLNSFILKLIPTSSIFLAIILFLEADFVADVWLHEPQLVFVLRIFALTFPFVTLTTIWLSGLQAFQHIDYQVYLGRIFQPFINFSLIGIFLFLGWRWAGVVWGSLLSAILVSAATGYVYFMVKKTHVGAKSQNPQLEVKEWLQFSLPLLFSGLLAFVVTRMTTLILGSFQDSASVGIYDVALKISLLIQLPLAVSNMVFAPIIGEIYGTGDLERLEELLKIVTKWVFAAGFFVFLNSILFAEPLLAIFGGEFVAGTPLLLFLGLGQLVNVGTGAMAWVLIMAGYPLVHLSNAILSALQVVLLSYWLIPEYGMLGAAFAVGLTMATVNLLRVAQVFYLLRVHPYSWDFVKPALAGVAVFVIIAGLQLQAASWGISGIPVSLLLAAVSTVLFGALLALLRFRDEEKELIFLTLRKLKIKAAVEG